jgi:hypothetical protein
VSGEDRSARLREALAAYDAALEHYRPEVALLDFAMTQNNRASALSELASLPGEDRAARLREALRCAYVAFASFLIKRDAGELFAELWAEIGTGEVSEWLRDA